MTAYVPNAFIQAPIPEVTPGEDRVMMKFTGVLVDMLVQLSPEVYGLMWCLRMVEKYYMF